MNTAEFSFEAYFWVGRSIDIYSATGTWKETKNTLKNAAYYEDESAVIEVVKDYLHDKHKVWGINARNIVDRLVQRSIWEGTGTEL